MQVNELERQVEEICSALVFMDEETPPAEWTGLQGQFDPFLSYARSAGKQILLDAVEPIIELIQVFSHQDIPDPGVGLVQLTAAVNILRRIVEDLCQGVADPRNFKSEIAALRLFLQDYSLTSASSPPLAKVVLTAEDQEFIREMLQRVDAVEGILLELPLGKPAPEKINAVFREFHTLKGETGILGMADLHRFFHAVETELDPLRKGMPLITDALIGALLPVLDCSRQILSRGHADEDDHFLLDALRTAVAASPAGSPSLVTKEEATEDDDFFSSVRLEAATSPGTEVMEGEGEESDVPDHQILHQIPVQVYRVDHLLEQVASLGAGIAQLNQRIRANSDWSAGLAVQISTLARSFDQLQSHAIGLRMTPIRPLMQRLKRAAYDVARANHKSVEVVLEGMDTEVDRTLIENLTGGLIHLVRNAVDHGIEAPARRRAAGKPEQGRLLLKAGQDGGDVVIEVRDDGQGLDVERIRQCAREQNLLKHDGNLSEAELEQLIFHPGFSTATRVTGTSGRGVGMSAVQEAVKALRGKVRIKSESGHGTTTRLILPLSMASIQGLLVAVGEGHYLIPAHVVRESFRPRAEALSTVEGRGQVVSIRGAILPVIDLAEVLGDAAAGRRAEDGVLVIVEYQGRLAALHVTAVITMQNAMIRPFEGSLARIPCISGVVLLEQGNLALVLEVSELLRHTATRQTADLITGFKGGDRVETVDIGSNQVAMVDFSVACSEGGATEYLRFAINAFKAREFVPMQALTSLPDAPSGFSGILLLRGRTIPVVNLARLLGYTPEEEADGAIIICEFGSHTIGIAVARVNRVNYISWGDILPPPESGGLVSADAVVGTIIMDGTVLFVLDFEQLVQQVLRIYNVFGATLTGVQQRKTRSRILFVEDSTLMRKRTAEALRGAGLEVLEASNGHEALTMLQELEESIAGKKESIFDHLDLVLSDIEMPLLDGYTLAHEIKKSPVLRALPVIFLSSLTNQTVIQRAKEVEVSGVVAKGDPAQLALQLRQYL